MKTYSESLEYQGLVASLEEAKSIFNAATAKKKEVKAFFKTTEKEAEATKARVYSAYFTYKQAKFNQKLDKLAVRFAKSNIKEFVAAFKETRKKEMADVKKVVVKKTAKKVAESQTDAVEKPAPKAGKTKQSAKNSVPKAEKMVAAKPAKKVVKKAAEKPLI